MHICQRKWSCGMDAGHSGCDSYGRLGSALSSCFHHCAQLISGCNQQSQGSAVQPKSAAGQQQWGVPLQHRTPALPAWHLLVSPCPLPLLLPLVHSAVLSALLLTVMLLQCCWTFCALCTVLANKENRHRLSERFDFDRWKAKGC